jgi:putative membrane protein
MRNENKAFIVRGYAILLIVNFIGLFVADALLDGVHMAGYGWGLLAAALLTFLHIILKPLLILLTLPMTALSMGLSLLVINALIFWLAGSLLSGFQVTGMGSAVGGALIISISGTLANIFLLKRPSAGLRRVFTVYHGGKGGTIYSGRGEGLSRERKAPDRKSPHPPGSKKTEEIIIDMENGENGQWKIKD